MSPPSLLAVCFAAFLAVFTLLALLLIVMRIITAIFPELREGLTASYVAAISSTYQALIPGTKITRIEEIK